MRLAGLAVGLTVGWLGLPWHHAAAAQGTGALPKDYSCGAAHRGRIEWILSMRYPGAVADSVDGGRAPRFSQALVIEDFLELKATVGPRATGTLGYIEDAFLRYVRDTGRVTPEVCEVVRFVYNYHLRAARADAATRPGEPEVSASPR
jgi:hypothetical protein